MLTRAAVRVLSADTPVDWLIVMGDPKTLAAHVRQAAADIQAAAAPACTNHYELSLAVSAVSQDDLEALPADPQVRAAMVTAEGSKLAKALTSRCTLIWHKENDPNVPVYASLQAVTDRGCVLSGSLFASEWLSLLEEGQPVGSCRVDDADEELDVLEEQPKHEDLPPALGEVPAGWFSHVYESDAETLIDSCRDKTEPPAKPDCVEITAAIADGLQQLCLRQQARQGDSPDADCHRIALDLLSDAVDAAIEPDGSLLPLVDCLLYFLDAIRTSGCGLEKLINIAHRKLDLDDLAAMHEQEY